MSGLKRSANRVVYKRIGTKKLLNFQQQNEVLEKETVDTVSDRKKSGIDLQYGHPLLSMLLQQQDNVKYSPH